MLCQACVFTIRRRTLWLELWCGVVERIDKNEAKISFAIEKIGDRQTDQTSSNGFAYGWWRKISGKITWTGERDGYAGLILGLGSVEMKMVWCCE